MKVLYRRSCKGFIALLMISFVIVAQEAPTGGPAEPSRRESDALDAFRGTLNGTIVWSSSRSNSRHDIWIMNADGTDKRQLTKTDNVDWFSRFSPDGKEVVFTRSNMGWVPETEAEVYDKWDIWIIGVDGSNERKVAKSASWASYYTQDTILFARGPKVYFKSLSTEQETLIFDAEETFRRGSIAQQPQISPDGRLLAMTMRGTTRETGIYNFSQKQWHTTGAGCQITFFPCGKRVLIMNEGQGRGGTQVLAYNLKDNGEPVERVSGLTIPRSVRFMDLPGRRSHEYFPKLDQTGEWMVWCAVQHGHDHDIYDYDMYIWNINTDPEKDFVRLTFHTGNDRWPDLYTTK